MTVKIFCLIILVELCEAASHILFKQSVNAVDTSSLRHFTFNKDAAPQAGRFRARPQGAVHAAPKDTAEGEVVPPRGGTSEGETSGFPSELIDYARFLGTVLKQPAVWLGLLLFTGGILTWFVVLAHVELSRAFPFGSLQYLTIMVASAVFLRERIDRKRLVGTLCIVIGMSFVAIN